MTEKPICVCFCVPVDEAAGQSEDPVSDTGPSPSRMLRKAGRCQKNSGMGRLRAAL